MSNYLMAKYSAVMDRRTILDETLANWARERPEVDLRAMGTVLRAAQVMDASTRALNAVLADHDLSLGEFDVLAALRRSGSGAELTPTTLARVGMVSPGGMTNRLDRLERAGLIRRRPDPSDRRGSLVTLTRAGRSAADRAFDSVRAAQDHFLATLSDAERARLDRALDKLLAALDDPDPRRGGVG